MNKKEELTPKVKLSEKLGFLSFSTAINISFNMRSTYYMLFLTNILELTASEAGTIFAAGTVWDAINDPLIGLFTANRRFKNGEKLRPYTLIFALPFAVFATLLFVKFDFDMPRWATILLCIVIYIFYEIFNTFVAIPYNSLGSLATNRDEDRKSINAFRSLGGVLGTTLGTLFVPSLLSLFAGRKVKVLAPTDTKALILTSCVLGFILFISCVFHYSTTRERVVAKEENEDKLSLKEAYKLLFSCKSWKLNVLYVMFYALSSALMMTTINYYAQYIMGDINKGTPVLASYIVCAIAISLLAPKVDSLLGRKRAMFVTLIIMVLGKIPFILMPYTSWTIYVNAATTGIGLTYQFVMMNLNRNNVVDIIENTKGKRIDSMTAAGDNLFTKLGEAVAKKLIGVFLTIAGFSASLGLNQPTSALTTIILMLGVVPCITSILSIVIVKIMDVDKELEESKQLS